MAKDTSKPGSHAASDMLTANLLAMLEGWTAYGYDLAQRLEEAGLGNYNKGTIYRTLRHMEAMGLVSSMWDTSLGGPARRMYSLTGAGSIFLKNWLAILDTHKAMVASLMALNGSSPSATEPEKKKPARRRTNPKKKQTTNPDNAS